MDKLCAIFLTIFAISSTDARLDIIFFNQAALPSASSTNFYIGGYSAGTDETNVGGNFVYGRVLDTGTGAGLPVSSSELDFRGYARRLSLGGGDQQPGVYYCDGTSTTGETERLHTVVLRSDAEIKPESHTKTVSWGEQVTLTMTTSLPASSLEWKLNGVNKAEWFGQKSITIPFSEAVHGGVYECYSSESQRSQGKHGMMKLIVTACPNGRYGPNCESSCPTCYNGGVCSATTGECICPHGFQGDQCQTACGKNKWGATCLRGCSSGNTDACRNRMFCIADPYGCSCSASYTGLDCSSSCPFGTYGAGCTQTCHCTSGCDAAIGCPAGSPCQAGWSGTYCNIPTSCPTGMYGELCNYNCHCKDNAACDRNTGECPSDECAPGWIPLSSSSNQCQQKGSPRITDFTYVKVNPGEQTTFTCKTYGNPGPRRNQIQIYKFGSLQDAEDVQEESSHLFAATFTGITVNGNEEYYCYLNVPPFYISWEKVTVDVYELPRFSNPPTVTVEATTLTITWNEWNATTDIGDGPVESYTVYYRHIDDNDWIWHVNFTVEDPEPADYSTTITGLEWTTSYEIVVVPTRPGPLGEGYKITYATYTTLCDVPTTGPTITSVTSSDPKEVEINIEVPSTSEIKCNFQGRDGYIESFEIRYRVAYSGDEYTKRYTNDDSSRSFRISGLTAYTEYEVGILVNNKHEASPWSSPEIIQTAEDVPAKPRDLTLMAGASTIDVQWLIPDPVNGVISEYVISYWDTDDNTEVIVVTANLQDVNTYQITGLTIEVSYSVQVKAKTGAGYGEFSYAETTRTTAMIPGMPASVEVSEITETSMKVTWTEPAVYSGEIIHYGMEYSSGESVLSMTKDETVSMLFDGDVYTHTLTGLSQGTQYLIKVNASTSRGFGQPNSVTAGTTFSVDVSNELSFTEEQLTASTVSETTAQISLPQLPEDSMLSSESTLLKYMIVAEREETTSSKRKRRDIDLDQLSSFNDSSVPYYITALIPLKDLPQTFIVGDGGVYGGYFNAPLKEGTEYYIYFGFSSDVSGNVTFYLAEGQSMSIPAERSTTPERSSSPMGGIIGGVIGALVLVVLIIAGVFLLRRHQIKSKNSKANGHLNPEAPNHGTHAETGYQNIYCNAVEAKNSKENMNDNDARPYANVDLPRDKKQTLDTENILLEVPDNQTSQLRKTMTEKPALPAKPQSDKSWSQMAAKQTGKSDHTIKVGDLCDYIRKKRRDDQFKTEYKSLPQGQIRSVDVAKIPDNVKKNRFRNILAYDHSRVVLEPFPDDENSDYINASYIDGYKTEKAYIATQGPLPQTVDDLWRMIWQENITSVLMTTNLVEKGKVKCHQYWPESDDGKWYGDIYVSLENTEMFANYVVRTFHIQMDETDYRVVKQFHFTVWPDMGVPIYATAVLEVLEHFKSSIPDNSGPPLIHCSAGVGRTGTFITIDVMLQMAKEEGCVDVFNFVKKCREDRMHFVQVEEQYEFIHTALLEATVGDKTAIPSSDFRQAFGKLFKVDKKSKQTALELEWENLGKVSRIPRPDECSEAAEQENMDKNRFADILPLNKQKPLLMTEATETGSNQYINASFVNAYVQKDAFLVTQMPMPHTVNDFWRMVYDYKSYTIVMLNDMDPNDSTIGQYWPENDSMNVGPFQIETVSCDVTESLIIRTLQLIDQRGETRTIQQYQVTGWPASEDKPKQKSVFIDIITKVEKWQQQTGNGPVTVHCINGVGRSGVYCAAVSTIDRIKVEQTVDVFQAVKTLRAYRPCMVETKEQYQLCYEAVLDYFESFDTYANFQ